MSTAILSALPEEQAGLVQALAEGGGVEVGHGVDNATDLRYDRALGALMQVSCILGRSTKP